MWHSALEEHDGLSIAGVFQCSVYLDALLGRNAPVFFRAVQQVCKLSTTSDASICSIEVPLSSALTHSGSPAHLNDESYHLLP